MLPLPRPLPCRRPRPGLRALPAAALLLLPLLLQGCGESADSGDPLTALVPFTPLDRTPPDLAAVTPADGAADVPLDAVVVATFSEPVWEESINDTTFLVGAAAGRYDVDGAVVTFTPDAPLAAETSYRVLLTTGIRDRVGNALAAPRELAFVTTAQPVFAFTAGEASFSASDFSNFPVIVTVSFAAAGAALAPDGSFPGGATEACGGAFLPDADLPVAWGYGARDNGDGTCDFMVVVVSDDAGDGMVRAPFGHAHGDDPWVHVVVATGAPSVQLPTVFTADGLVAWVAGLDAASVLVSRPPSGRLRVDQVGETVLSGAFAGSKLVDRDDDARQFDVTAGAFSCTAP